MVRLLVRSHPPAKKACLRARIAGDINQLNLEPLFQAFTSFQLVKSPTSGSRVLHIFATNVPFDFGKIQCVKGLMKSDHKCVILSLKQKKLHQRENGLNSDSREHCKLAMSSYLKEIDWSTLLHNAAIESAVECFYNMISPAVDQFSPKIKVKLS